MGYEITLSPAQLGALNNGTTVELGPGTVSGRITINPPCEEAGHDWGRYRIEEDQESDKEEYKQIRRHCTNCDEEQTINLDMSQVFQG